MWTKKVSFELCTSSSKTMKSSLTYHRDLALLYLMNGCRVSQISKFIWNHTCKQVFLFQFLVNDFTTFDLVVDRRFCNKHALVYTHTQLNQVYNLNVTRHVLPKRHVHPLPHKIDYLSKMYKTRFNRSTCTMLCTVNMFYLVFLNIHHIIHQRGPAIAGFFDNVDKASIGAFTVPQYHLDTESTWALHTSPMLALLNRHLIQTRDLFS